MTGQVRLPPTFQVVITRQDTMQEVGLEDLVPTRIMDLAPTFIFRFLHEGKEAFTFEGHRIELHAGGIQAFARMVDLANEASKQGLTPPPPGG